MKRLITSTCYVIVMTTFFLLKIFLGNSVWMDVPFYAFSLVGTFEILRALEKDSPSDQTITLSQKVFVWIYAVGFIPLYAVMQEWLGMGVHAMFLFTVTCFLAILLSFVMTYGDTSVFGTGKALIACVYPTTLLGFILMVNHLPEWNLSCFAIMLTLLIPPGSDSFAYMFGKYLRCWFPQKMSPVISPNKTIVGCIGGLIGGATAGIVGYYIYLAVQPSFVMFSSPVIDIVFCVLLGLVGAVACEVGDLLESAIKRKVGIKDSGKILPGHGGVLDRIDSTLVVGILMCFAFGITLL